MQEDLCFQDSPTVPTSSVRRLTPSKCLEPNLVFIDEINIPSI